MSGPLLISQQTTVARVRTLSSTAAARLMRNAIRMRRGVVKSITILAPLLETNRYIVLSLPSKVIQQFMTYVSSLNVSKRQAFVSGWISKNQVALITQHAKSGYKSRFSFKIEPIPKVLSTTPVPRRVAHVPKRATPRPARARKTLPPAFTKIPAALRPTFDASKRIVTIPVPSSSRVGSRLLWRLIRVSLSLERRKFTFQFGLNFVASKSSGRVSGYRLAAAITALLHPYIRKEARLQVHTQINVPQSHLDAGVRRSLKKVTHSDVKRYLSW